MAISFRKLHPSFVAEVSPVDLRLVHDEPTLARIRAGMDEHAVLVFRDQSLADEEHLAFARRLDGELHSRTGSRVLRKSRLGNEALGDISNLDENGEIMKSDDRRRMYGLANRLWHTDASFRTRPADTRCSWPGSSRPCPPTPSSPTCARPTTASPRRREPRSKGSASTTPSPTRGRSSASSSRARSRTC